MTKKKSLRRQPHGTRNTLVLASLAVAAIVAIAYVGLQEAGTGAPLLIAGDRAPSFTLSSTNGTTFSLGNFAGRSDVLLFFNEGLSCSPCLQQMVDIDRNYSDFSKMGLVVVTITTDSPSSMKTWAQNNQISRMLVLSDPMLQVDRDYDTLNVGSMHPGSAAGHTFILVGKDGNVIWRNDYGSSTMYVPMGSLLAAVRTALG